MTQPLAALARVDLNLLTAFIALADTRHVTRAARLLGVSQPALSHAVRRLRATLGDPLFVRAASGIAFTPFAEEIVPAVREALHALAHGVFVRRAFVPAELTRTFHVRTTDFVEALLLPRLLARLAAEAPGVQVASTAVGPALPASELARGACDLAIAGFFEELPEGMQRQTLFEDRFACAVREGHPLARTPTSLAAFCAARHLIVAPGGVLAGAVDRALARKKRTRTVVAGASSFLVSAWICAQSDQVLTAPARLLDLLGPGLGLTCFPPPLPLPAIRVAQIWHARDDADPAHRWFRGLVRELLATSPASSPPSVRRGPRSPRRRPGPPSSGSAR